jgi:biopolymer transport protein ExbB
MITDLIYELFEAGGWVMIPIFLLGFAGLYLVFSTISYIGRDMYTTRFEAMLAQLQEIMTTQNQQAAIEYLLKQRGMVARILRTALEHAHLSENAFRNSIREKLTRIWLRLDEGIHLVGVLAAAAPLLGLLGTVNGMVQTFETITIWGNQNPVLMAGGISKALITTQSGLLVAFPLVLFRSRLSDRITWLKKQIELGVTIIINQNYHNRRSHGRV